MQLKELMTEKFGKSDEEADYIEEVKTRTVYELLVLKKELKEKKHEVKRTMKYRRDDGLEDISLGNIRSHSTTRAHVRV